MLRQSLGPSVLPSDIATQYLPRLTWRDWWSVGQTIPASSCISTNVMMSVCTIKTDWLWFCYWLMWQMWLLFFLILHSGFGVSHESPAPSNSVKAFASPDNTPVSWEMHATVLIKCLATFSTWHVATLPGRNAVAVCKWASCASWRMKWWNQKRIEPNHLITDHLILMDYIRIWSSILNSNVK